MKASEASHCRASRIPRIYCVARRMRRVATRAAASAMATATSGTTVMTAPVTATPVA